MSHALSDSFATDTDIRLSIPTRSTPDLEHAPNIDSIDVPILRVNRSWQVTFLNSAATAWFARVTDSLFNTDFWSIWPEPLGTDFAAKLTDVMASGPSASCEFDVFARDRRIRAHVQATDSGLLLLLLNRTPEDDALRFQAELLDQAYSAYFAWELDGGIILWNRGAERLYGYDRNEAMGQVGHTLLNTIHPFNLDAVRNAILEDGIWHGELYHTRKDGTHILVESRHQLVIDGERMIVLEANRDISEPRRLYEQVLLSEQRLRMAIAGSSITVYQQDHELRYTWFYNAYGRPDNAALGMTDADILPPDEAATLTTIKQRVLDTGHIERAEIQATVNTRTLYFDLTVEPMVDSTGAVVGITGAAINITRQRERESQIATLQELTAALASAVDAESVARAIVDHGAGTVGANLGYVATMSSDGETLLPQATTGFCTNETSTHLAISMNTSSGIADAARQQTAVYAESAVARLALYPDLTRVQALGEGGAAAALPLQVEDRLIGVLVFGWAEERTFDGEARDFLGALADLCAQALDRARLYDAERQARDAAQIAEARYRGLFERSADAVLIVDERGEFQDANTAALELLGYDRDELYRLTLTQITQLTETSDERDIPLIPTGETWLREFELRRHDETFVPVEARATTIQTPTGTAMMITARDISDRRMFERMQQEFFASISHDLKNPLAALRGQVQLMQRRLRRKGVLEPNDAEPGLETIESVGERMTGMIEELVDVAQLRSGNPLRLKYKPTDLAALAFRRVREHQLATTRHTVRLDLDESSMIGWWDESRLGRVIDNLLTNAIKYSPGGDIDVRLYRESRDNVAWAMMTITDTGLGIPAEDLPRIFERFRRGSNVLDRFAGTGLGLAGVRQIVLQHGGDVSIASTEGVGTTVTVALPIMEPDEAIGDRR